MGQIYAEAIPPLHSRILTIFYLVEEVQYKLNCHKYHGDHNRANEVHSE